MFLAAIARAQRDERRARLLDARIAAVADEKSFDSALNKLTDRAE
jgi:hypothetical protein